MLSCASYHAALFFVFISTCSMFNQAVGKGNVGFSLEGKLAILHRHNLLRRLPQASNMMMMQWDTNLEKLAENWAKQCIFEHSKNRSNVAEYKYVGENLYAGTGEFDPVDIVQAWYNETDDYNYETLGCKAGKMCGHYTQVVWADSKALGCSVKYCEYLKEAEQFGFNKGYNVVCHYGPGGNYVGQKPYKLGDVCSLCPAETRFCVNKLCAMIPQIGSESVLINNSAPCCGSILFMTGVLHIILNLAALS